MKCPEWANPLRQKIDSWLTGDEGVEIQTADVLEFLFRGMEMFWNWIVVMAAQYDKCAES